MPRLLFLTAFLISANCLFAQDLDSAFYYSDSGDFEKAWRFLKAAVESKTPLPDKAAFLHGKLMYHKGNFVQAKAGFSKYLGLAGDSGEYSAAAREFLSKCDRQICQQCQNTGYFIAEEVCDSCDINGVFAVGCTKCAEGIVLCPSCKGNKYEVKRSDFGAIYMDCRKCSGEGKVTCPVCKGTSRSSIMCRHCGGDKKIPVRKSCQH